MGDDPSMFAAQISEYLDLMQAINGDLEPIGLVFVGFGSTISELSSLIDIDGSLNYPFLLLIDLPDQESASCRVYTLKNGTSWEPSELELISDPATSIAVNDTFQMSRSSDVNRAKLMLRDRLRELRVKLELGTSNGNEQDSSEIITKYGQLRKLMAYFDSRGNPQHEEIESIRDANVIYELIARVIEKSDIRHENYSDSGLNAGHSSFGFGPRQSSPHGFDQE